MDLKSTYSVFKFCLKWKEIFISLIFNNIGLWYFRKNLNCCIWIDIYFILSPLLLISCSIFIWRCFSWWFWFTHFKIIINLINNFKIFTFIVKQLLKIRVRVISKIWMSTLKFSELKNKAVSSKLNISNIFIWRCFSWWFWFTHFKIII